MLSCISANSLSLSLFSCVRLRLLLSFLLQFAVIVVIVNASITVGLRLSRHQRIYCRLPSLQPLATSTINAFGRRSPLLQPLRPSFLSFSVIKYATTIVVMRCLICTLINQGAPALETHPQDLISSHHNGIATLRYIYSCPIDL